MASTTPYTKLPLSKKKKDDLILKEGDRVFYKRSSTNVPSRTHPMQGTEHACLGTVVGIDSMTTIYSRIQWDNGYLDTYLNLRLGLVMDKKVLGPNQAFKVAKSKRIIDDVVRAMPTEERIRRAKRKEFKSSVSSAERYKWLVQNKDGERSD